MPYWVTADPSPPAADRDDRGVTADRDDSETIMNRDHVPLSLTMIGWQEV